MLWFFIGALVIAVVWLWHKGKQPAPNRIESPAEVTSALQFLIRRGVSGGQVRFQVDDKETRAVIFTKYVCAGGEVGLRARCSQGTEAPQRFSALVGELNERGIEHEQKTDVRSGVIEVNCRLDLGLALMLVVLAFQRLFGVALREHCVAFFEGVLNSDEPSLTGIDNAPS